MKKIKLKDALMYHLDYKKQSLLNKYAPEKIEVPSGSNVKLLYSAKGEVPVLAVRLQEVFGMQETPTVNEGKINVLMHLLSPGFKPVQITGDLPNFWKSIYFEVKKVLKRKYPKHEWPDDPLKALPIRGVKRKS